jgi:hypothetical protein
MKRMLLRRLTDQHDSEGGRVRGEQRCIAAFTLSELPGPFVKERTQGDSMEPRQPFGNCDRASRMLREIAFAVQYNSSERRRVA